jgi:hypothetical protein
MSVLQAAEHRLLVVVTRKLAIRRVGHQPLEVLVAAREATWLHPLRRADGHGRLLGIRQVHGAELAAEETRGRKRLDLLVLTDAFEPLPDVHECRHHGIPGPEHAADPGTDVGAGDCLRRHVAGVPVVLVA